MKIFSLEDSSEKRILIISNIIGCMDEKTYVDSIKIPNAQTTILLLLANVVPRREVSTKDTRQSTEGYPTMIDLSVGMRVIRNRMVTQGAEIAI